MFIQQCECHNYTALVPLSQKNKEQSLGTLEELKSKDANCPWWQNFISNIK